MSPIYRPWQKGPAQIIPFPGRVVRCWLIEQVPGGWRGRTVGIPEPDDGITEVGELWLVLDALTSRAAMCARRGLPIVSHTPLANEVSA